jgi:N-acetylmuramoyl-L-alanine amidase
MRGAMLAWLMLAVAGAVAMGMGIKPAAVPPRPVVVLDPGHGGVDPGALGPGSLLEKQVDLAVAHQAARILAQRGIPVVLTRSGDTPVAPGPWHVESDLRARAHLANRVGAALLISIHANSEPTGTVQGPIVYWERGDAASLRLARCLETALAAVSGRYHAPRPAGHLVLLTAAMPAVTVEVGFLSHPAEAAALASAAWQATLGQAIALGVIRYLDTVPAG